MFHRTVAPGVQLKLLETGEAKTLFALAERNRARLRQWLPWVDQTRSVHPQRPGAVPFEPWTAGGRVGQWSSQRDSGLSPDRLDEPELQPGLLAGRGARRQGRDYTVLRGPYGLPVRRTPAAPYRNPVRHRKPAQLRHPAAPRVHEGRRFAGRGVGERSLGGPGDLGHARGGLAASTGADETGLAIQRSRVLSSDGSRNGLAR